jgi:hypothetical protein
MKIPPDEESSPVIIKVFDGKNQPSQGIKDVMN